MTETNLGVTGSVIVASPAHTTDPGDVERTTPEAILRQVLREHALLAVETTKISRQVIAEDGGAIVTLSPDARSAFRKALAPLYDAERSRLGPDTIDAAVAANSAANASE